ncbi:MAG TPA: TonB-dependent receptor [Bryobacteraceae bacterium]
MSKSKGKLYLLLPLLCLPMAAQENTATITGQALDASGAAVPGARIVARNVETGIQRATVTADTGDYTIPLLPIGTYEVSADKNGFKRYIQSGLVLQVDQHARVDIQLQIGAASESVMVTAEAPLTQTDTSSVGSVIDNQKVVEMPLNGRQFYSLALLVPGVAPPAQGSILSFRGGFNVAGSSELNNNFTLNGLENNDQLLSAPAFRPSVDAIQEFKILTGVFPAEYGRNAGSQVIVTTRSGGNKFHGSVFEFLRNQVTDAKNYFTPANSSIPAFKQNQFGGTLGGPIIHNKTFFFASYEGTRSNQQVTALTNVPLPAMLTGDFSGISQVITNPLAGNAPFPGNKIPANLISPIGQALANYYPIPTSPTPAGKLPSNNYVFNQPQIDHLNLGSLRIDHTFSAKDTLNASYNDFEDSQLTQNNTVCGSRVIPGFDCTVDLLSRLYGLTETHLFSPSLVNEFKVGVSQFQNPRLTNDQSIKFIEQFGIQGTRFDGPPYAGVPQTSVQGFATIGEPTNFPQQRVDRTYQLADGLTWVHGRHSLKFGVDLHRFQANGTVVGNGRGSFTFSAQTSAPTSSYALADLLLGLPTSTARSPYSPRFYDRTGLYAGFVQDDWKFSPRFTLNLGLRYEYNVPIYDHRNLLSNFNPVTGQIDIAGANGVPQAIWDANYRDFEPRIGFSWQPFASTTRTVIRGGYGIFYNAPALNNINSGPQQSNAPFVSAQTLNSSVASPITLANPFPAANVVAGTLTLSAISRHLPDAQAQQWSLNVQQALTQSLVLEVGYQGAKGTHLPLLYNINQPPPGLGTVAQKQALRPYPQFGNITYNTSRGDSNFEGLVAKLEQRFHGGLSFLVSYMHGKSIDDTPGTPYNVTPSRSSAEDPTNFRLERGLSGFDLRNRFVFSPVYQLPFGKGKPLLGHNKIAGYIAGGWEVSGILSLQSGRPFTALVSKDNANVLGSVDRPNVIGDGNAGPRTVQQWINTSAFALAPAGTFGNAGRNNLFAPPFKNLDAVVSRVFPIRETLAIQLRIEAFNATNHPNFDAPVQTFDNPSFGSIQQAEAARQLQFGLKIKF